MMLLKSDDQIVGATYSRRLPGRDTGPGGRKRPTVQHAWIRMGLEIAKLARNDKVDKQGYNNSSWKRE